ncbi:MULTISPECIES: hypothetical protein [Pseudoalteromonas]|uniref:Uncharacterized protein n=1 Tax=Pseudoalteromonas luteoviolacea (strain 2ta16) TaxID=1353533 RepID=V4HMJ8_PSEL2|nr:MULTISPECIES: hypothetical protein [Pseudoalteromonas]ESP90978.1 hypothetical protein PL2TA16_01369 [Pseudoalteromonas luteoviolacea 2ta16]KZN38264.1 hypothetical protein N483_20125 [Pseudoalteromonas luteoviolacea NCIMB 1944]MBQ4836753.1 hypothetical protein [Pseudoalteromonas luteoviolacea]MCG7547697.1 hypothetical protein [Pseudoalteromonas sp. Of7M-16]
MNLLHEMSVAYGHMLATDLMNKAKEREQAAAAEQNEDASQSSEEAKNTEKTEKPSELEGAHKLSHEEKEKLSGREAQEKNEDKYGDLPDHIRRMLERLEEMKEELDLVKQEVAELNAKIDHNDEAQKAFYDQRNQYFLQLQTQYFDMIKNVKDAMKEAGVTDMSVLIKVIA